MTPNSFNEYAIDDKIQQLVIWALQLATIVLAVWAGISGDWETSFVSVLTFGSFFLPFFVERRYRINLPVEYELYIVTFMFGSFILGEVGNFYERFAWWDAFLHVSSGAVLAFLGYLILYVLYHQKKLQASPGLIAWFTFAFGMALGGVWEIFEFSVDRVFGLNMQKDGLNDTMWDLIVDACGGTVASLYAYRHISGSHQGWFKKVVHLFIDHNPRLSERR